MQQYDLIFVRHAESKMNEATHMIVKKYGIPNHYNNLKNIHEWVHDIKYSIKFLDCPLSQIGIQQCQNAKSKADSVYPDVILVSPMLRTLQTCNILFGDRKIPIIVEPILIESIRSSSDIPANFQSKYKMFPAFQFQEVTKQDELWYFKYDMENYGNYKLAIEKKQAKTTEEQISAVLQYMEETRAHESPANIRNRVKLIKQLISKYREKYSTILVVSHFNTINCSIATEFDSNNEPKQGHKMGNCEFYYTNLHKIKQYS